MSPLVLSWLLLAAPGGPVELARGEALFAERCAVCHGKGGAGDGDVAGALSPAPADLTRARFAPERLAQVLRDGVPGTAMPAQPALSPADRDALVAYVRTLGPREAPPLAPAGARARGAELFAIRCAACHGAQADGRGPSASRLGRPPTDFTRKQPTPARVADVLTRGVPGTAMTPMRRLLTDADVDALAAYITSMFGRDEATGTPPEAERAAAVGQKSIVSPKR